MFILPQELIKLTLITLSALLSISCSLTNNPYSIREFDLKGNRVGVNVSDATRRVAIISPNGNVCSEMSPPAIVNHSAGNNASASGSYQGIQAKLNAASNVNDSAVKLSASSERIECLRISLFHACGLASSEKFTPHDSAALYTKVVQACSRWTPPTVINVGTTADTETPDTTTRSSTTPSATN